MQDKEYVLLPHMLTVRKAADHFGVSEYCIRAAVDSGDVKCLPADSRLYVSIPSLAKYFHCTCLSGYTQITPMAKIKEC